jgi:hypothetical protein
MDIDIELLQLTIDDAAGHEHRIRPIAMRAAQILAERLQEREGRLPGRGSHVPRVHAGALRVDLNRMNNERAALSIATAWIEALTVKLEAGG